MVGDVRLVERPAAGVVEVLLAQDVPQADQDEDRDRQRQLVPAEAPVDRLGGVVEPARRASGTRTLLSSVRDNWRHDLQATGVPQEADLSTHLLGRVNVRAPGSTGRGIRKHAGIVGPALPTIGPEVIARLHAIETLRRVQTGLPASRASTAR